MFKCTCKYRYQVKQQSNQQKTIRCCTAGCLQVFVLAFIPLNFVLQTIPVGCRGNVRSCVFVDFFWTASRETLTLETTFGQPPSKMVSKVNNLHFGLVLMKKKSKWSEH